MPRSTRQAVGTGILSSTVVVEFGGKLADLGVAMNDLDAKQQSAVKRHIRKTVREFGQELTTQIKSNASWSSRIPATVRVNVTFTTKSAGASVIAGGKSAPHARPLERGNKSSGGGLRHPVFARKDKGRDEWTWVDMPTRPFFFKAVQQKDMLFTARVNRLLDDIANELGFTGN
jgi:hypothetical protein